MDIDQMATSLFGKLFLGKEDRGLQENIRKARMNIPADVYKSRSLLYSLLTLPAGVILGFLIGFVLGLGFPLFLAPIFLLGAVFMGLSYQLFLLYPGIVAGERAREIDAVMPYASAYMYALSRSGIGVGDIFRDISEREDMGELATEAKAFRRNTQYLGQDPVTALRNLSESCPSDKLSEFLEVLVSMIETGGDIPSFFKSKCAQYRGDIKETQEEKVSFLEFMGEAFIIIVILAPLLFLTILGVFEYIAEVPNTILKLITYGWVPIGSIGFIVMISTKSPVEVEKKTEAQTPGEDLSDVKTKTGGEEDKKLRQQVRSAVRRGKIKSFLSNPFRTFARSPSYVLLISVPVAVLYALVFGGGMITTTTLVVATLIAAVPYVIAYEFRAKRIERIERALPDFLNTLEGASESGLALPRAISVTSTSELGPLTDEVKRTYRDIEWGNSASEALINMEHRVRESSSTTRATTLIRKASEAEADISDVVDAAKENARVQKEAEDSRKTSLSVYKIVLLLTFGVFLFTVYLLVGSFLAIPVGGGMELPATNIMLGAVDISLLKRLFFHLLMEVGIFSGLIAAQLETADLRGGIKYALVMMVISWAIFEFILMPMEPRTIERGEEARMLIPLLLGT